MTVKELIEELQKYPSDKHVWIDSLEQSWELERVSEHIDFVWVE